MKWCFLILLCAMMVMGVHADQQVPSVSNVVLSSGSGTPARITDPLTVCYDIADPDGDTVRPAIAWTVNGSPLSSLYMPFEGNDGNENATTADYSGNSRDGTVNGAVWSRTSGIGGTGAYYFSGTTVTALINRIAAGNFNPPDPQHVTLTAWINANDITHGYNNAYILAKGNDDSHTSYAIFIDDANQFATKARANLVVVSSVDHYWVGAPQGTIHPNQWHHVVGVIDGNTMSIYTDGELQNTRTFSGTITSNANTIWIGAQNRGSYSYPFKGWIDEPQIINRALSADQVRSLYTDGLKKIVSSELAVGQTWQATVVPNDGYTDGAAVASNSLTLVGPAVAANFTVNVSTGPAPLAVQFTDTTSPAPASRLWEFGDGTTSIEASPVHVYSEVGTYNVALHAVSAGGEEGTKMVVVTATNSAPIVAPIADQNIDEGATASCSATFTDSQSADTHTAMVNWGDGSGSVDAGVEAGTVTASHVYADNGAYSASLTVTDDDGAAASVSWTVSVANVAPTVEAGDAVETAIETELPFNGTMTDPGSGDRHTVAWSFGDGGTADTLNVTHKYAAAGTYSAVLTVTDDDGGVGTDTRVVTVGAPTNGAKVRLEDSTGVGLAGAVVQYYASGWKAFGSTDATGVASLVIPPGTYTFRTTYGGASIDVRQNITANPVVTFRTARAAVELRDSHGAFLDGGSVQYYAGGWRTFGTATGGRAELELLPVTYTFRMAYAGATSDLRQDTSATPTVVFSTNDVQVELRDSRDQLTDTGVVQYYAGGWQAFGTTSGGVVNRELLPATYTFRMQYRGKTTDLRQNVSESPVVVYRTATPMVTVRLLDSRGGPLAGGEVQYYASGWKAFGTTGSDGTASMELLPGQYTLRMTYANASIDQNQNLSADSLVTFRTARAAVELRDSHGAFLDGGSVQYYAGGWRTFGTATGGRAELELLPVTYTFRMAYAGATSDLRQDISATPTVVFSTDDVQVELRSSTGELLDGGTAQYYAGSWHAIGTMSDGKVSLELLPVTYTFRMVYRGTSADLAQNVGTSSTVEFATTNVVVELRNSTGVLMDQGFVKYYAGAWRDFGTTSAGRAAMELFPGTTTFRMIYAGASTDLAQNLRQNAVVVFQTGEVISDSDMCNTYYASGWRTFENGMELLPLQYTFRFSDGTSDTKTQIVAGSVTHIH